MPCKRDMFIFVILLLELRNNYVYGHTGELLESTLKRDPTDASFKINWKDKEVIAESRDQGVCDAAWAYSAIGAIEGQLWRWFPERRGQELSVQQLIDCDTRNKGCQGGYMRKAYDYLISRNMGLMFLKDYPTTEYKGSECEYDPKADQIHIYGYTKVPQNEDEIREYLKFGPLSAAIIPESLKKYNGGIIDGSECDIGRQNHAVVIIGYDEEVDPTTKVSTPYWILKNSWGADWGENGTFRLIFGKNACGIAEDVSAPILEHIIKT